MGRKDLLRELMAPPPARNEAESETEAAAGEAARPEASRPEASRPARRARQSKGAIGAVGQTIADLKSRALVDLDPGLIDAGGVVDRLDHDETAHAALTASIRDYGQQVPVLVRPHPEARGRYQIVYGRRRVLALRDLGQPVKAMVRDLDDRELVIAQGQENAARRDLSFIEKANFARQLRDAGYARKIICDALHIDKTAVSRMLSVVDRTPLEVIEAIGAAPGIGRDRWLKLADLIVAADWEPSAAAAVAASPAPGADGSPSGSPSEARFESLYSALAKAMRRRAAAKKGPAAGPPAEAALQGAGGRALGRVKRGRGAVTLILDADAEAARFADWLAARVEDLHRDWLKGRGGE